MNQLFVTNLVTMLTVMGGIALCVAALHALERSLARLVAQRWGWRALLVTGWVGVPLHELSHLLTACLFGHRIIHWSLLDPDPQSGTLGYVRHAYRERSLWQLFGNFWIGVAPILAGGLALGVLLSWMAPHFPLWRMHGDTLAGSLPLLGLLQDTLQSMIGLAAAVWRERTLWLPLQLYLAIAVACHMAPSWPDLQSSMGGFIVLVLLVIALCALGAVIGVAVTPALAVVPVALWVVTAVAAFEALWALLVRTFS